MKRNKIKKKYLDMIKVEDKNVDKENNESFWDKWTNKIIKGLFSLLLIFLLLCWGIIPMIMIAIMGFDLDKMPMFSKLCFMLIGDLLFLALLIKIYYKDIKRDFKNYFGKNFKSNFGQSLKYWLAGFGIMYISNLVIAFVIGDITNNEETVRTLIDTAPWYMGLNLAIYAPLTEELIFRKSIRNVIDNRYLYAIVSGVIFGGLHVISSITGVVDLLYLIPYCALGIAFGLLYSKSNNIFSTIVVHSIHNTLAFLLYLLV